jgi:hypothetical protein
MLNLLIDRIRLGEIGRDPSKLVFAATGIAARTRTNPCSKTALLPTTMYIVRGKRVSCRFSTFPDLPRTDPAPYPTAFRDSTLEHA